MDREGPGAVDRDRACGPGTPVEDREFAGRFPGAADPDLLPADLDPDLPIEDEIHVVALLPLVEQIVARLEHPLLGDRGDLQEVVGREPAEQFDLPQGGRPLDR